MSVELRFLGWDAPATVKVREFLVRLECTELPDLSRYLIVVPTRQADRRLREALAVHCASMSTAVLSLNVRTPPDLVKPKKGAPGVAEPNLEVAAVWTDVLMKADLNRYSGLFPARAPSQDLLWALRTAEMIQDLRGKLADGGYSIAGVCRDFDSVLEEKERWHDLAELETEYLKQLGTLGLQDPCEWMLQNTESDEPPGGAERIVVAGVPDPTPLMVRKRRPATASQQSWRQCRQCRTIHGARAQGAF